MIGEIWNDGDSDYLLLGVRFGWVWAIKFMPGGESNVFSGGATEFFSRAQFLRLTTDDELQELLTGRDA